MSEANGQEGEITRRLLQSDEPVVRYKVRLNVLGEDPASEEMRGLREEIRRSPRVQTLLSEQDEEGNLPHQVYRKWVGAHWVLADLADNHYPPGDEGLILLREQQLGWLLHPRHVESVKVIRGRARRCASQEGNALFSLLRLGLADERCDELAANLRRWQWPDGGWNCDKNAEAVHASFMESLIPLRGLALHARMMGSGDSQAAAERAAEIFLKRRLFRRQTDGSVMAADFLALHYPCYWHYDILFGLKVLAEAGFIGDPRCEEALDLLESMRLADGGFPATKKYYRKSWKGGSGMSLVDWGGTGKQRMNPFVTADALGVLRAAGRTEVGDWATE